MQQIPVVAQVYAFLKTSCSPAFTRTAAASSKLPKSVTCASAAYLAVGRNVAVSRYTGTVQESAAESERRSAVRSACSERARREAKRRRVRFRAAKAGARVGTPDLPIAVSRPNGSVEAAKAQREE